jgi:DMSO/TMAO reductase YedYZ molybdopterin-dependent catalytic subunit
MAELLRQAGAQPDAAMVMFEGTDSGRLLQDSPELPYARVVPVEKCRRPESILAFKLN